MDRTQVATARKKLLRRGRAILRKSKDAGSLAAIGRMAQPDLAELREIHAALERIERGIYGRCEGCHAEVDPERLDAMPWERDCASCRAESVVEPATVQGLSA